jgi:protease-4
MKFAGKVWKLLVGIKDGLVLLFMLLFFGLLWAAMQAAPGAGTGSGGALLLDLAGPIVEQPSEPTAAQIFGGAEMVKEYRLRDVLHSLKQAASDDAIEAVVLDLDIFAGGGQTALGDVADAIEAVKTSGKPVLAFATAYSDDSYLLASHASEVWLDPMGGVLAAGPGGTGLYMKGLLDRLGVTANVYRAGAFKSAVEPFTRSDMSPESRQAMEALAGSLWESWRQDVTKARPKAKLDAIVADPAGQVAAAGGDMAKAALAAGLVDKVGDRGQFARRIAEITGTQHEAVASSFRHVAYDDWISVNPAPQGGRIGIVTVAGEIVDGEAGLGTAGAETIVRSLEEGLRNNDLKAIVLRVDSPGGSALASERIRRAVLEAKAKGLPVVVSMGNLAASGGYWVATAGDRIFAEPSTITGSIGVFGILPSFEGSLAKLGIGADGVKTTPISGEPDLFRGPNEQADRLLQMSVDSIYRRFLTLVSGARKIPFERANEIGQGRVWDGGTARQLGLVDAFGSLDDAVAEAARRAGLDAGSAGVVWLERQPGFAEAILAAFSADGTASAPRDAFSRLSVSPDVAVAQAIGEAERLLRGPAIQARCLECAAAAGPTAARVPAAANSSWMLRLLGL